VNGSTNILQSGTTTTSSNSETSHSVGAALGYEFVVSSLRIRPELSFLYSPGFTVSESGVSTTSDGHVIFYPNVTIALVGPAQNPATAAEH
jgi:hypothetical protein